MEGVSTPLILSRPEKKKKKAAGGLKELSMWSGGGQFRMTTAEGFCQEKVWSKRMS